LPHVHVVKGDARCKVLLDVALTPYGIRMTRRDVRAVRRIIEEYRDYFTVLWETYHG